MRERFRATLIGCAIGDTLGMPVEGWKKSQIKKYAGRITEPIDPIVLRDVDGNLVKQDESGKLGYYSEGLKRGEWTDDTILTLALAESIVAIGGLDLEDIAQRQLAEYRSRLLPDGAVFGGFGSTTTKAFKNLDKGVSYLESAPEDGGPGNAPAMKMAPVGLFMYMRKAPRAGLKFAGQVGEITHRDPRSIVSGIVQAHAVYHLLLGAPREDFNYSQLEACSWHEKPTPKNYPHADKGSLASRLEWIWKNPDASVGEAFARLGNNSLVFRSYPFALFMFQKYWDNPVEGLLETVNWGGDCDTTGAIYGALCGAKNGMVFPQSWLGTLQGKERLTEAADGIFKLKENEN